MTFCDSISLSALVAARQQLPAAGRRVRIINASAPVVRLLHLASLDTTLRAPNGDAPDGATSDVAAD